MSFSLVLVVSLGLSWVLTKKQVNSVDFTTTKWFIFRFLFGIYLGYLLGIIIFYWVLNLIFFRNTFVTIPFLFGMTLIIGILGTIFGNPELTPKLVELVAKSSSQDSQRKFSISKLRLFGAIGKVIFFLIIALLLTVPNTFPLLGGLASPPSDPDESYLNIDDLFGVNIIRIEHSLPSNISDLIEPENSDGKWYTYIYLPDVGTSTNLQFPVLLYLHGYSGIDIDLYHSSMKTFAQRGVIGIFVQYATTINLITPEKDLEFDHPSENPELSVRYAMEWSGINQAVDALNLESQTIGTQTLLDNLGDGYQIDYSRLTIIGHSMGGGMVPYIATKSLERGWGSNELILDMEAPWYASSSTGSQPDYSALPSHTLLNVATYEDDHSVSQCIGMDFYERIRQANGTLISEDQLNYVYIYSDFHGFPRLLASHYLPVDAVDDPLQQFGYKKRIKAMAFYLFQRTQEETIQLSNVLGYFLGEESKNMGNWSDGRPVNEAYITDDPYGVRGESSLVTQIQDNSDELCTPFEI